MVPDKPQKVENFHFTWCGYIGFRARCCVKGFVAFFPLIWFNFYLFFLNIKPLSVKMACLLGIQNEIQAVCLVPAPLSCLTWTSLLFQATLLKVIRWFMKNFFFLSQMSTTITKRRPCHKIFLGYWRPAGMVIMAAEAYTV